jgi:hypothetical protein
MVKHVTLVLLFVMGVCTLGCAQSTALTRAKAKDIIENSSAFFKDHWTENDYPGGPYYLRFPDAGQQNCTATKELLLGAEEGYWVGGVWSVGLATVAFGKLTDKGNKYFQSPPICNASGAFLISGQGYAGNRWVIPPMTLHGHIAGVTGITGDDLNKKVELWWMPEMNELPGDLRRLFPAEEQRFEEEMNLTLYDDGWRVVN